MAQVIVRNIEESLKEQLKARAQAHGWSMEEEVRQILRRVLGASAPVRPQLGSHIAQRFAGVGLMEPLAELRGQSVQAMDVVP